MGNTCAINLTEGQTRAPGTESKAQMWRVGLSNFQFYRTGKNGAVKVFLPVKPLQLGKSDSV